MRLLPNELGTIAPSKAYLFAVGSALIGFWIFGDLGRVVETSDRRKSYEMEDEKVVSSPLLLHPGMTDWLSFRG